MVGVGPPNPLFPLRVIHVIPAIPGCPVRPAYPVIVESALNIELKPVIGGAAADEAHR